MMVMDLQPTRVTTHHKAIHNLHTYHRKVTSERRTVVFTLIREAGSIELAGAETDCRLKPTGLTLN